MHICEEQVNGDESIMFYANNRTLITNRRIINKPLWTLGEFRIIELGDIISISTVGKQGLYIVTNKIIKRSLGVFSSKYTNYIELRHSRRRQSIQNEITLRSISDIENIKEYIKNFINTSIPNKDLLNKSFVGYSPEIHLDEYTLEGNKFQYKYIKYYVGICIGFIISIIVMMFIIWK